MAEMTMEEKNEISHRGIAMRELIEKINSQNQDEKKVYAKTNKNNPDKTVKTKKETKLSYNQKRLLEVLPKEIEQLEREIETLTIELSDPNLYQENPKRFDIASAELEAKQVEKSQKEENWLELQILADEMEA